MITDNYSNINIFLSLKNFCSFLLAKEKTWKIIFNTICEISRIRKEKQIMPLKTTVNWLFKDIWRYLVIGCFDWKIGLFQQTFVRVYYILKDRVIKHQWRQLNQIIFKFIEATPERSSKKRCPTKMSSTKGILQWSSPSVFKIPNKGLYLHSTNCPRYI